MKQMFPKHKKPKPVRRALSKKNRIFFLTLLTAVTLISQTRLLEQASSVRQYAVQEGAFTFSSAGPRF